MGLKISVIVPIPPELKEPTNISILNKIKNKGIEVIIVTGRNPSKQRNIAVTKASGDILYFIDEDSIPRMENLDLIRDEFEKNNVDILGGPSVLPEKGPTIEEVYYHILSMPLIVGGISSRYTEIGKRRRSGEGELILCNMAVRKQFFQDLNGFPEDLYPNEENAFLVMAKRKKANIIYNPVFTVEKAMKLKINEFIKLIFKYGKGRGNQTRRYPSTVNIIKLLTVFFLPLIIFSIIYDPAEYIFDAYLIYDIILAFLLSNWTFYTFFHYLLLIPLTHSTYGIGIVVGLFSGSKSQKAGNMEVTILK